MEYVDQNQVRQEETSSNPQISAFIPRAASNGIERMCRRHGSNSPIHYVINLYITT